MPSRRKVTVKPGRTRTVRTPGGGHTRSENGRGAKVDVEVRRPKK